MAKVDTDLRDLIMKMQSMQVSGTKTEKDLQAVVAKALNDGRKSMMGNFKKSGIKDPRGAYKAVRRTVYKSIIGGNINILSRRKAGKRLSAVPSRRSRSSTTERYLSYAGTDRGFILRWMNNGTDERVATSMNDHAIKRQSIEERNPKKPNSKRRQYKTSVIGARGSIKPTSWFSNNSEREAKKIIKNLEVYITALLNQRLQ